MNTKIIAFYLPQFHPAEQTGREEVQPQAQVLVHLCRCRVCRYPSPLVLHPSQQARLMERIAHD